MVGKEIKPLMDYKCGDTVKIISKEGKFITTVIRETLKFLECDLSSIPQTSLNDFGKINKMMFSRYTGIKKGSIRTNDLEAPYIIGVESK